MTSLHNQRFNKRNIKPHTTICDREDCAQCFGPPPIFQPKSQLFSPKSAMLVRMGVQSPDVYGGQAVAPDPTPEAVALAQTVREEYVAPICNDSYEPFNGGGSDEYTCEHVGFDASGFTGPAGTLKPNVEEETMSNAVLPSEIALAEVVARALAETTITVVVRYVGDAESFVLAAVSEEAALRRLAELYGEDGEEPEFAYQTEGGQPVFILGTGEFEVREGVVIVGDD